MNAQHTFHLWRFQLWYETCVDIPHGTELVLGPREPLNLQDMFGDSTSADEKSDRETGNSRHSRLAPRSEIIVRATPIAVQIIVPIGKTPPSITQRRRNPFYQCYMTQDPWLGPSVLDHITHNKHVATINNVWRPVYDMTTISERVRATMAAVIRVGADTDRVTWPLFSSPRDLSRRLIEKIDFFFQFR